LPFGNENRFLFTFVAALSLFRLSAAKARVAAAAPNVAKIASI
jgi:hypothetical protein